MQIQLNLSSREMLALQSCMPLMTRPTGYLIALRLYSGDYGLGKNGLLKIREKLEACMASSIGLGPIQPKIAVMECRRQGR